MSEESLGYCEECGGELKLLSTTADHPDSVLAPVVVVCTVCGLVQDHYLERGTLTIEQQARKSNIVYKKKRDETDKHALPVGKDKIKGIRRYKRGLIEYICYKTGYYGFEFQKKMAYNCSTPQLERIVRDLKENSDNAQLKQKIVLEIIMS